ncbi:hypothetical protein [Spongiactinospora sp. TRM90649]|uniref:hypothetical protein n=1 Tax=Spongiactinospora sp. TRM90649 TaxID=3031114 RepID=UPI0023F8CA7C|nr:hypothetical protein [Spongiactinospora sp. TRM90649]MDF5757590.1 hypothetical protein [Spongiactinospora sp. TRM90649]
MPLIPEHDVYRDLIVLDFETAPETAAHPLEPAPAPPAVLHRALPEAVAAALTAATPTPSVRLTVCVAVLRIAGLRPGYYTCPAGEGLVRHAGPEQPGTDLTADAAVLLGGTPPDSPHAYRSLLVAAGTAAEVITAALGPLTGSITLSDTPGAWPLPSKTYVARLATVTLEAR